MRILDIQENEEGGKTKLEVELTKDEQRLLIERGFNEILSSYIFKDEEIIPEHKVIKPNNTIYCDKFKDINNKPYYLFFSKINYKHLSLYEGLDLCNKFSERYKFDFPYFHELQSILNNFRKFITEEFREYYWYKNFKTEREYGSYIIDFSGSAKIYEPGSIYNKRSTARIIPVCRLYY